MELSQRHSSSAQPSDYTAHFHAAVSLQKHSTLKNGTVLKQFFCLYYIFVSSSKHPICCFLVERVKLLLKVRKKLSPIFSPKHQLLHFSSCQVLYSCATQWGGTVKAA